MKTFKSYLPLIGLVCILAASVYHDHRPDNMPAQKYIAVTDEGRFETIRALGEKAKTALYNAGEPVHVNAHLEIDPDTCLKKFTIIEPLND